MKDSRTYIKLHDGMFDHPKIDGLSDGAFRTLIGLWCWCSRHLTDGYVPEHVLRKRAKPRVLNELIEGDLIEVTARAGHYYMHDYLEHQRSSDEVAALRTRRAEAGSKGGKAKAAALASASDLLGPESGKSVPETETETETETRRSKPVSSTPAAPASEDQTGAEHQLDADVETVCRELAEKIHANRTAAGSLKRKPTVNQTWRLAAYRLIHRDKVPVDKILKAIEWCQQDEFWAANIESMPTLRKQFDKLRADAVKRPAGVVAVNGSKPSTTDQRVRAGMALVKRYEDQEASDAAR